MARRTHSSRLVEAIVLRNVLANYLIKVKIS